MADLLSTWQVLKQQADAADAEVLERLARAYAAGYEQIDPLVQALTEQINALQQSGEVTPAQIKKSAAYKNLISAVQSELDEYAAYMRTETKMALNESAKSGLDAGRALMLAGLAEALSINTKDIPADTITTPTQDALGFLADYLNPDGKLYSKINGLSKYHADEVAAMILDQVSQGKNPKVIGKLITDTYGMGLTDSIRMMRTAQLYSYRQANNAVQVANAELLQGVVWCAELDADVCASCVSLHGQVFPVGTVCDDHHNGRAEVEGNIILSDDTTSLESIDYMGDIIIIGTASGKFLAVTPKHPVLTDRGWIPAYLVNEGCNVLSANFGDGASVNVSPYKNNIPTAVEDIASSNGMIFLGVPESAKYLNRDGGRGKVDAIFMDSFLWNSLNTLQQEKIKKLTFGIRHSSGSLSSNSGLNKGLIGNSRTPNCILGFFYYCFSLFRRHGFISERIGLGQGHNGDIVFSKDFMNPFSSSSNGFSNRIFRFARNIATDNFFFGQNRAFSSSSGDYFTSLDLKTFGFSSKQPIGLEMIRQSLLTSMPTMGADFRAITAEIVFDRVTKVDVRYFTGHVYSLQTKKEWYYSNNIISHNCAMLPYVKGMDNPIQQTGEDWFKAQDEQTQRDMLGTGKYEAWQDGKFEFSALSTTYQDDVYGEMRREATLQELIGE